MTIPMTLPVTSLLCPSCGAEINALTAEVCQCIAAHATVICPSCRSCLCRNPAAVSAFLRSASSEVTVRLNRERNRREDPANAARLADVLIVDDDEEIRDMAAYRVEQMGYRVRTATGAAEALQMIEQTSPDIVLTDALMPLMDGRTLCRRIKDLNPRIKVVIMTSLYTAPRYKAEAHRVFGADGYLAKPVDFPVLEATLGKLR